MGAAYRLQFAPGSEYDVVTFVLDRRATTVPSVQAATGARLGAGGAALPAAADLAALAACPAPGCVLVSADEVRVRAWADAGQLELVLTGASQVRRGDGRALVGCQIRDGRAVSAREGAIRSELSRPWRAGW